MGWNYTEILTATWDFVHTKVGKSQAYPRHQILKLIGCFYAGSSYDEQLPRMGKDAVGILGKLSQLTASILGGASTPSKVGKCWHLDIDPTYIPSNKAGIVTCGIQRRCLYTELEDSRRMRLCLNELPANQSDFTSHIEPDWDYDARKLLVTYRHNGRIVYRLSPFVIDKGVFGSRVPPVDDVDRLDEVERAIPVNLENFCGGRVLCDREHDLDALGGPSREHIPRLVILTGSAPKARAYIVGMY